MKHTRIIISRHGGPDVLQAVEEDLPEPPPGEARVRVLAAGVSGYDLMLRRFRMLPGMPRTPFTLGTDLVGVVDKLGEGASGVAAGTIVAGASFSRKGTGCYAEYVCLPASELVPVPAGVDPVEAVCATVNYLTAHMAMHRTAGVGRGERVLVHGAAGGVGTALLSLGRLAGLEMYGTCSAHTREAVAAFGAQPIDYHSEDFVQSLRDATGGGADAVFDPVGGGRHLRRSHRALRDGGRLVWFGMAATKKKGLRVLVPTMLTVSSLMLFPRGRRVLSFPDLGADAVWYRKTLAEILAHLAAGRIRPLIAARIPLTQADRAHAMLERGGIAGKIVLTTNATIA